MIPKLAKGEMGFGLFYSLSSARSYLYFQIFPGSFEPLHTFLAQCSLMTSLGTDRLGVRNDNHRGDSMNAAIHRTFAIHDYGLSRHAWQRMGSRGFSPDAIRRVLEFGRVAHVRGATIYAVGRKEVAKFEIVGIDLSDVEGIQVVCSNSVIMTVYRNHNFRGLRPRRRPRRYRHRFH